MLNRSGESGHPCLIQSEMLIYLEKELRVLRHQQ
jgi:hypothetical protein